MDEINKHFVSISLNYPTAMKGLQLLLEVIWCGTKFYLRPVHMVRERLRLKFTQGIGYISDHRVFTWRNSGNNFIPEWVAWIPIWVFTCETVLLQSMLHHMNGSLVSSWWKIFKLKYFSPFNGDLLSFIQGGCFFHYVGMKNI